ncbi:MAG TPA: fructosamine kinase family protein [Acidimicrobiales bacterium]
MGEPLAQAAAALGRRVVRSDPVSGGCITDTRRVVLDDGTVVFCKLDASPPPELFEAEAAGLRWLRAPGAIAVPKVLAVGEQFLVTEWVEPGRAHVATDELLGRGLALLHRAGAERFGRIRDGRSYLATLELPDDAASTWGAFWVLGRVRPLAELAVRRNALPSAVLRTVDRLAERIDALAGPPEPPSRVHGDLWSGNVHVDRDGRPWLVDPSAHGGHRETDLAMLALFGGFDMKRVIAAYEEVAPLADGWRDRVALHQLVPLLAHVVLFGSGYVASTRDAFAEYLDPGF